MEKKTLTNGALLVLLQALSTAGYCQTPKELIAAESAVADVRAAIGFDMLNEKEAQEKINTPAWLTREVAFAPSDTVSTLGKAAVQNALRSIQPSLHATSLVRFLDL